MTLDMLDDWTAAALTAKQFQSWIFQRDKTFPLNGASWKWLLPIIRLQNSLAAPEHSALSAEFKILLLLLSLQTHFCKVPESETAEESISTSAPSTRDSTELHLKELHHDTYFTSCRLLIHYEIFFLLSVLKKWKATGNLWQGEGNIWVQSWEGITQKDTGLSQPRGCNHAVLSYSEVFFPMICPCSF